MKIQKVKKISFVLFSTLLLTMAGCKHSAPATPEPAEEPVVQPETPKTPEEPGDVWYDTKYKAVYAFYTAKAGEHMKDLNTNTCEDGYSYEEGYAIPAELLIEHVRAVLLNEDTTKNPKEALFAIQAFDGYYIQEDSSVPLPRDVSFTKINYKSGYWQWITDEYSN
ncbi:hypothetical protein SAMN04487775_106189 [Treponema bryantii]|uniref:Lipoprotein n=1 Tax=Treponema bryantii TaxID=163 RepID=A0A1I3LD23_9SPIR|nr:hypothetical protein [Treponema bryantii]SFI82295.1 hypothetical protein SAMN04487775_106189 [Treponema bryantii]